MSGNMSSHGISMVYGGLRGFGGPMVADRFIPAYERPFLVFKNGNFPPYGQILKIRFSAIKNRILDFLSDSESW